MPQIDVGRIGENGSAINNSTMKSKWSCVASNVACIDGHRGLVSDTDAYILSVVINCILNMVVIAFGVTANLINLAVFTRQGFADSINVSFASLATADLLALLFAFFRGVLFLPPMQNSPLPIDAPSFMYLLAGWPHSYFVRVGSWVTAFITFERCLCIAMPLKVKRIITPRRVVFIHFTIYLLIASTIAPVYFINKLSWKFYPDRNRSLIGLIHGDTSYQLEKVLLHMNGNAIPLGALIINVACTSVLVAKLNSQIRWRHSQALEGNFNKTNGNNARSKESRIITMAVTISTIYIVFFGPVSLVLSWMSVDPQLRPNGKLKNVFAIGAALVVFLQACNSSVNIIVYYKMSSKFKSTFHEIVGLKCRQTNLINRL